jgi:hypothetical protein
MCGERCWTRTFGLEEFLVDKKRRIYAKEFMRSM